MNTERVVKKKKTEPIDRPRIVSMPKNGPKNRFLFPPNNSSNWIFYKTQKVQMCGECL